MAYSSKMKTNNVSIAPLAGMFVTEKIGRFILNLYLLILSAALKNKWQGITVRK